MEIPFQVAPAHGWAKWPIYEFMGVRYYRKPSGYFKAQYDKALGTRYLHRVVWEYYHGVIPEGFAVHHVDGRPDNNHPDNLALISASDHARLHMSKPGRVEKSKVNIGRAVKAAAEWRRRNPEKASEMARACGAATRESRKTAAKVSHVCAYCGKLYEVSSHDAHRSKFCSPNCRCYYRRDSGVDDIDRPCSVCGRMFRVNRYTKVTRCQDHRKERGRRG